MENLTSKQLLHVQRQRDLPVRGQVVPWRVVVEIRDVEVGALAVRQHLGLEREVLVCIGIGHEVRRVVHGYDARSGVGGRQRGVGDERAVGGGVGVAG